MARPADVGISLLGLSYNTSALGLAASLEPFVRSHRPLPLPTRLPNLSSGHFKMDGPHHGARDQHAESPPSPHMDRVSHPSPMPCLSSAVPWWSAPAP